MQRLNWFMAASSKTAIAGGGVGRRPNNNELGLRVVMLQMRCNRSLELWMRRPGMRLAARR